MHNVPEKEICILFPCVGRRVSLLNSFRKAAQELGIKLTIVGADCTELSSALQTCDEQYIVEPVEHPNYIEQLKHIVQKHKAKMLIPTVDLDLPKLAQAKDEFKELGCINLVSDADVVDMCQDKRKTFKFLKEKGFGVPKTYDIDELLADQNTQFPYYLKPWDGYASKYNAMAHDLEELKFHSSRIKNCIVQDFIDGKEYTCDVYVGFDGEVKVVVPRLRMEVRSGEVSKSKIIFDPDVIEKSTQLVKALKAGPGVITTQQIKDKKGDIYFMEINPRFGGGAPLSIKAGANFPKWLLQHLSGMEIDFSNVQVQDGLTMLRYDSEVWVD